jgi:hypothetical protein
VLLRRHFAVVAELRAAVGRLALLLELEGADVLLSGLERREAGHGAHVLLDLKLFARD